MTITDRNLPAGTLLKATHKKAICLAEIVAFEAPEKLTVEIIESAGRGLDGSQYSSLSKAAMAITGNSVNGWRWWSIAGQEPKAKTGPDPRPATERFWAKVNKDGPVPDFKPELGPCWIWEGAKDNAGYGNFTVERNRTEGVARYVKAHTFAFVEENGPLPTGLEPDHLCRVHACVRPSHMEAVTRKVNLNRGAGIGGALSDGRNPGSEAAARKRNPSGTVDLSHPEPAQRHTVDAKRSPEKAAAARAAVEAATAPAAPAEPRVNTRSATKEPTIAGFMQAKKAERQRTVNPIRAHRYQGGLEPGERRYICDGCQDIFIGHPGSADSGSTSDYRADNASCPAGHIVGTMRGAASMGSEIDQRPGTLNLAGPVASFDPDGEEAPEQADATDPWTGEEQIAID